VTQPPTKCIFCGLAGPLTNEHIWSRWTHRFIPKSTKNYRSLRVTSHQERSDFKVFKRPGDIQDWKVRCVCGVRCNNGWMRKSIDEPARNVLVPLIKGESTRLTPDQQLVIAAWATLKAMVAEYDRSGQVVTHHMQRKFLMNTHKPPTKGWAVWIGHHVRTPKGTFHWGTFPALIIPDEVAAKRKSNKATYYNSAATSWIVGQLFMQIIRSPHRKLISQWKFHTPNGGTLYRIWPPSNISIVWPPKSMTARDVDYVIGAFKEYLERTAHASVPKFAKMS